MSDLTDFLLARIAEDEASAPFVFAEQYSPARVLAECAAKRQIVELHTSPLDLMAVAIEESGTEWEHVTDDAAFLTREDYLHNRQTLRALATPYADHPGYRQEWAL